MQNEKTVAKENSGSTTTKNINNYDKWQGTKMWIAQPSVTV